jgi:hypothetical protein
MSTLRAFVMNSRIRGESSSSEDADGRPVQDTLVFTCDGQRFILTTKGEQLAEILVENVDPSQEKATIEAIERICWLLAFATQSHVVYYKYHYPDGSPRSCRTVNRPGQNVDAVFDPTLGSEIRRFVDLAYPLFKALEGTRSLTVVIDYMLQSARPGLPLECKLVFMFVLLENIKHTYGTQQQYASKSGKFVDPTTKKPLHFQDIMNRMFGAVGMAPNLQGLVKLRNLVIHTGMAGLNPSQQQQAYDEANDLIREYVLRLLGYTGHFNVSRLGGSTKKI